MYDFGAKHSDGKLLFNQLVLCNYGRKDLKDKHDPKELNIHNYFYTA